MCTFVHDGSDLIKNKIIELLTNVTFPCTISIDGNGFLEGKEGNVIFCFSSPHHGLILPSGKSTMAILGRPNMRDLINFVENLTDATFEEKWMEQHDLASDYKGSGFTFRRLVNIVITLDPLNTYVKDLLDD